MKWIKDIAMAIGGLIAAMYLTNIGAGVIELIPDNVPFIGNLDEAGAVLLLIKCLAHFGLDLRKLGLARNPAKR